MAWTATITHNTGDVLPASDWNTYVRDNLSFLHDQGADLVAAATITPTTQFHKVTGNTGIGNITILSAGTRLVLWFTGTPVLTATASGGASGTMVLTGGTNYTAAANDVLHFISDGTQWRQIGAAPVVRAVQTSSGSASNTVTETDLLGNAAQFALAGGTIGANTKRLRFWAAGKVLNSTGASQAPPRFRLKYGASILWDSVTGPATSLATGLTGTWLACLDVLSVTNTSQLPSGFLIVLLTGSPYTLFNTADHAIASPGNTALSAVDTSVAGQLAFTVLNPTATATYTTTLLGAELIVE